MKTHLLILFSIFSCLYVNAQVGSEITDFNHAAFQFSFITPPLSTNGIYFYETVNDLSLNTFLGISAGTESLEIGGFANVDLYYANGIQMAGFANLNGILQESNNYRSNGVQLAGFANVNGNTFDGVQLSGFANANLEATGLQGAGFANINNKASNGLQLAGFANLNIETQNVAQLSGFANVSLKGESGPQISGFGNIAQNVSGIQAAGFFNIARNVKGVQLAGFINICDSIDGVPISFISYVRKNGYRSYEVSASEWAPVQLTFRMGTKALYNIYTLSKQLRPWDRYAFGFGFGHAIPLADRSAIHLELTNHSSFKFWTANTYHNYSPSELLQFKPVFKRDLGNGICLNFGPTLNFIYGYRWGNHDQPATAVIQPFWKSSTINDDTDYQSLSRLWVGFTAGVSLN